MSNLKVGDIVKWEGRHWPRKSSRGVITKFVRVGVPEGYPGATHYYATVFAFKSADSLTISADRLTKVEVRGE